MKRSQRLLFGSAVALAALVVTWQVCNAQTVPTVSHVDLQRYQGRWYELARLPLYWERKCAAGVTATYTLRPDGTVDVLNQCRKQDGSLTASHGTAKVAAKDGSNARLKVTFFWPFAGDYWILALDPEYRWALVGTPNRKNLWVLSRTPTLGAEEMRGLLERAKVLGYRTDGLIYTKQDAAR